MIPIHFAYATETIDNRAERDWNLIAQKVRVQLHGSIIGERERANLVVQLARFFGIYIYIYIYHPALMYAVMFYVILNKRKLH